MATAGSQEPRYVHLSCVALLHLVWDGSPLVQPMKRGQREVEGPAPKLHPSHSLTAQNLVTW